MFKTGSADRQNHANSVLIRAITKQTDGSPASLSRPGRMAKMATAVFGRAKPKT
jgi:hypothetical protein